MGLENVRQKLAEAEVAEVCSDTAIGVRAPNLRGLQGSCRGRWPTSAPVRTATAAAYEGHAEVAEVSNSFTRARAHARTRAREQIVDTGPLQTLRPLHVPGPVTLLKYCRCMDCRRFSEDVHGEFFCESYIGGMHVEWATGKRYCDPPPDAWHYCADYHGPLLSDDVLAVPKSTNTKPEGTPQGVEDNQACEELSDDPQADSEESQSEAGKESNDRTGQEADRNDASRRRTCSPRLPFPGERGDRVFSG